MVRWGIYENIIEKATHVIKRTIEICCPDLDPKWKTFVRIACDWADCTGFRVYKLTKVKRKRRGRGRRVAGTDRIPDFRCYKCLKN